jgi:catalase
LPEEGVETMGDEEAAGKPVDVLNDGLRERVRRGPVVLRLVELGGISLDKDPIPRVDEVEAWIDPLLDARATAYLISGRERRAA